jgi:hypothetical protein
MLQLALFSVNLPKNARKKEDFTNAVFLGKYKESVGERRQLYIGTFQSFIQIKPFYKNTLFQIRLV